MSFNFLAALLFSVAVIIGFAYIWIVVCLVAEAGDRFGVAAGFATMFLLLVLPVAVLVGFVSGA